jgi:hypothetical protein
VHYKSLLIKYAMKKQAYSLVTGPLIGGSVGGTIAERKVDPDDKERIKKIIYGVVFGTGGGLIGGVGGQLGGGEIGRFTGSRIGGLMNLRKPGGSLGTTIGALLGTLGGAVIGGRLAGSKASD